MTSVITSLIVGVLVSLDSLKCTDGAVTLPSETPELTCSFSSMCFGTECNYRRKYEIVTTEKNEFSSGLEGVITCGDTKAYIICPRVQGRPETCSLEKRCYTYNRVDTLGRNANFSALEILVKRVYGGVRCRSDSGSCLIYNDPETHIGYTVGIPSSCTSRSISDSGLVLPSTNPFLTCSCSGKACNYTRELVEEVRDYYSGNTEIMFSCYDQKIRMECPDINEQEKCRHFRQCYKFVHEKSSFGVLEMLVKKVVNLRTGQYEIPLCYNGNVECPVFYETPLEVKYVVGLRSDCTQKKQQ